MQRVIPLPPFDREYFAEKSAIEVEARNLFALVQRLNALAPGFADIAEARASFAVNGTLQADWTAALPPDCEVLVVPRISGG